MFFRALGRPQRLKVFYKQGSSGQDSGDLSWEALIGSCSVTTPPPFSLILLSLEGDHVWDKKMSKVLDRKVNHKFG